MKVSFCIVALNEEAFLPSLFRDIENQDYPHQLIEIIFVDSGSTDNTRKLMNEFAQKRNDFSKVKIFDNPKQCQASGWNIAIREARNDIIFRIDAHSKIPSDFVKKNVEVIQSGENVSGGPRPCISVDQSKWGNTLLTADNSMFGSGIATFKHSTKKRYVNTVFHGAYRREVFEKAGLFNENLGRTEDNEMHYRIRQAGFNICYSPDIISYQYCRNTWRGMLKQKFGNGYWIGLTLGVCPKCFSVYHFVPMCFVLALFSSIVIALFGCALPLILLVISYFLVNLFITSVTAYTTQDAIYAYILPVIFLSLHLIYGAGTVIGVVYMPIWKRMLQ